MSASPIANALQAQQAGSQAKANDQTQPAVGLENNDPVSLPLDGVEAAAAQPATGVPTAPASVRTALEKEKRGNGEGEGDAWGSASLDGWQMTSAVAAPSASPVTVVAPGLASPPAAGAGHAAPAQATRNSSAPASTSPASGEPAVTAPPPALHPAQVVARMERTEMRLGLQSETFGAIRLHTSVADAGVGALVSTAHPGLRAALVAEAPSLEKGLAQHAMRLASFRVDAGGAGSGFNSFENGEPRGQRQASPTQPNAPFSPGRAQPAAQDIPLPALTQEASGRLDIRI